MPCTSLASVFPQELFDIMLSFVGDERILSGHRGIIVPAARREEMQHLSACVLTCVDWARLCRKRMFSTLVLRSIEDIATLRLFSQTSPSTRFPSVIAHLTHLITEQIFDHDVWWDEPQWFETCYEILEIRNARGGLSDNVTLDVRVSGGCSVITDLESGDSRTVGHPLLLPTNSDVSVHCLPAGALTTRIILDNIDVGGLRGLSALLQELEVAWRCLGQIDCHNISWNGGIPKFFVQNSISNLFETYFGASPVASGCTDDILAALCASSLVRHGSPPHPITGETLSLKSVHRHDCTTLMHIMRTLDTSAQRSGVFQRCEVMLHGTNQQTASLIQERFGKFGDQHHFIPNGSLTFSVGEYSLVLPAVRPCTFTYLAYSGPSLDDGTVAHVRHVLIEIHPGAVDASLRAYDWDELFQLLRLLPHLNCIAISCKERKCLSAFVEGIALSESDGSVRRLLQLWYEETPNKWTRDY